MLGNGKRRIGEREGKSEIGGGKDGEGEARKGKRRRENKGGRRKERWRGE